MSKSPIFMNPVDMVGKTCYNTYKSDRQYQY